MSLKEYHRKRNFGKTNEPKGVIKRSGEGELTFVIQEHHARRLHWDLRLEAAGVLKSWAITKEPSKEIGRRELAVETEDHPLEYGSFEGEIPRGEYGAGLVKIWDRGTYVADRAVTDSMERGVIEVVLRGKKLKGRYVLVRTSGEGPKAQWLFFKAKPKVARLRIPDVEEVLARDRASPVGRRATRKRAA